MDRLAWVAGLSESRQQHIDIRQGPGFVSFEDCPEAYASVFQIWNGQKRSKLLASAALFQMFDGKQRYLILQEGRDLLGLTKGVWGFPIQLLRIDERPENAALAALNASLELMPDNNSPWEYAEYRPQGNKFIEVLSHTKIMGFVGGFVQTPRCIVFYIPLEILCANPYAFDFRDKLLPKSPVRISHPIEIDYFAKQGLLSNTTELIWRNYKESLFWVRGC